jgi:hypothetical protein
LRVLITSGKYTDPQPQTNGTMVYNGGEQFSANGGDRFPTGGAASIAARASQVLLAVAVAVVLL